MSARFAIAGRAAEQPGLTGGRAGEAQQQLDGRRLARAIGPRKPKTSPAGTRIVRPSSATVARSA
jgi:hypothetical protein